MVGRSWKIVPIALVKWWYISRFSPRSVIQAWQPRLLAQPQIASKMKNPITSNQMDNDWVCDIHKDKFEKEVWACVSGDLRGPRHIFSEERLVAFVEEASALAREIFCRVKKRRQWCRDFLKIYCSKNLLLTNFFESRQNARSIDRQSQRWEAKV